MASQYRSGVNLAPQVCWETLTSSAMPLPTYMNGMTGREFEVGRGKPVAVLHGVVLDTVFGVFGVDSAGVVVPVCDVVLVCCVGCIRWHFPGSALHSKPVGQPGSILSR